MSRTSRIQNYIIFSNDPNHDPWVIKNTWNKFNLVKLANGPTTPNYACDDCHYRDFVEWCKENVSGLWTINRMQLYLLEDTDAMAFKLWWT